MSNKEVFEAASQSILNYLKEIHPLPSDIYVDLFPDLVDVVTGDWMKNALKWLSSEGYIRSMPYNDDDCWVVTEKGWKTESFTL